MHVAREPVELGDGDRARLSVAAGASQGGGELRAAVERVGALARLDLVNSAATSKPSASAKRATAARWASMPRPERPCSRVLTR